MPAIRAMPSGSERSSRARRFARPALLGLAAVTAFLATDAFARLQPPPGPSLSRVRITGSDVVGLYPGGGRTLMLTLRNLNSRHAVVVRRIRVQAIASTKKQCLPGPGNLWIQQYAGPDVVVPAASTRMVTAQLGMSSTVPNGCQRAIFTLRYTADTWFR
jgi:hypothetical protein